MGKSAATRGGRDFMVRPPPPRAFKAFISIDCSECGYASGAVPSGDLRNLSGMKSFYSAFQKLHSQPFSPSSSLGWTPGKVRPVSSAQRLHGCAGRYRGLHSQPFRALMIHFSSQVRSALSLDLPSSIHSCLQLKEAPPTHADGIDRHRARLPPLPWRLPSGNSGGAGSLSVGVHVYLPGPDANRFVSQQQPSRGKPKPG